MLRLLIFYPAHFKDNIAKDPLIVKVKMIHETLTTVIDLSLKETLQLKICLGTLIKNNFQSPLGLICQ